MTDQLSLQEWAATIEAVIFAAPKPVRAVELQNQLPDGIQLDSVLPLIEARFDATGGLELCRVGDAFAFRTRARIAERLNTHKQVERRSRCWQSLPTISRSPVRKLKRYAV